MATNKAARDTMVIVVVIIAFAVTVMANLLADRKFARLDLTAEQKYSVSDPFRNILGRLDDTLTITYYVSGKVPGWFEASKRDILDKLKEIETAAKGKIVVEPIDPTETKELKEALEKEGFEHAVQEMNKDQYIATTLFTGIKLTYKAKPKVSIPAIGQAEQLEYQLGSKILELTVEKKPVVAVQVPPSPQQPPQMMMGRPPPGSGFEWLQRGWGEESAKFELKSVDLTETSPIPPEAKLFVLVRPKALNERQRYEVVKYLAGGGKLLLLASPYKVSHEFGWRAEKTPTGLEDYLQTLGVTFSPDFVCDHSNLRMVKSLNLFTGEAEYSRNPFFVRVLGDNIDQESVLTRFMPGLMMPSPGEIKLDEAAAKKGGLTAKVLAKTSKQSWNLPFSESVNPDKEVNYDENTKVFTGSKTVFVMLTGKFPFPYDGKPVPSWKADEPKDKEKDEEKDKDVEKDKDKEKEKEKEKEKKGEIAKLDKAEPGALVLCSAPEAFHSMYLQDRNIGQQMQGNASLMVNIIETFSLGDDLVKLRSKRYETRSINTLAGKENDVKRNAIKVELVAGAALLVVLIALGYSFWRRSRQVSYERKFSQTIGPSSFNP